MSERRTKTIITVVEAWLEINNEGTIKKLPILGYTGTFAINTIPTATVNVAIGKLASELAQASKKKYDTPDNITALEYIELLKYNTQATVWSTVTVKEDTDWTAVSYDVPLFAGYVVGTGLSRGYGNLGIAVNLVHWMADLDRSCVLTSLFHGLSAESLLKPLLTALPGTDAAEFVANNKENVNVASVSLIPKPNSNILDDIWGSGLKLAVLQLAGLAPVATITNATNYTVPGNGFMNGTWINNKAAQEALSTGISGFPGLSIEDKLPRFDNTKQISVVPLRFKLQGTTVGDNAVVSGGFLTQMNTALNSAQVSSAWDLLLHTSTPYGYAIIPTVLSATAAPMLTRVKDYYKLITPTEYSMSDFNDMTTNRETLGVILLENLNGPGANSIVGTPTSSAYMLVGTYPKQADVTAAVSSASRTGHIAALQAPTWLNHTSYLSQYTSETSPKPDIRTASKLHHHPMIPKGALAGAVKFKAASVSAVFLGDNFAKMLYFENKYRMRRGSIHGKLRFDICPGSQVRVNIIPDARVSGTNSADMTWVQGCVESVTISIDAMNRQVGTSFVITGYRTKNEEENEPSPDSNPLYSNLWLGSTLCNVGI